MNEKRLRVLYKDRDLAVIYKPCGLLSVPYKGAAQKSAQELLSLYTDLGTAGTVFAVHRLDRETSGVMMFALTAASQKKIMEQWKHIVTERVYRAVGENPHTKSHFLPDCGTIEAPLALNAYHLGYVPTKHDTSHRKTIYARTDYTVIARGSTHTLFELSLFTGKKNQIRAHLSYCGYPLAGDTLYRAHTNPFGRLALHARTLAFTHPFTQKQMRFEVPEPKEWETFVTGSRTNNS